MGAADLVADGNVALGRGDWEAARGRFEAARDLEESGAALDGLARALWWLGDVGAALQARAGAFALLRADGADAEAAAVAVWLARQHRALYRRDGVADGWLARASSLIDELDVAGSLPGWLCLARGEASDPASRGDDYTQVDDLAVDTRWPEFALRCVEQTGIRSMLSVRLLLGGEDRAAMNLYAATPAAFDEAAVSVASILGPFAGLSVARAIHESDAESLQMALRTSRQIGRAVGILMAQREIPSEEALTRLIEASQHLNRKLRDVAADVERTGSLPQGSDASEDRP